MKDYSKFNYKMDDDKFNNLDKNTKHQDINEIADKVEEETMETISSYLRENNLSANEIKVENTADMTVTDSYALQIIRDYISKHMDLKERIFSSRLSDFHRMLHEDVKANVLADIGIKKLDELNSGAISESKREIVEAEIMILFVQVLILEKEHGHEHGNDKNDNKDVVELVANPILYEELLEHKPELIPDREIIEESRKM